MGRKESEIQQEVDAYTTLIDSVRQELDQILVQIQFSEAELLEYDANNQRQEIVQCQAEWPFHYLPKKGLEKHMKKCHRQPYGSFPSHQFYYAKCPSVATVNPSQSGMNVIERPDHPEIPGDLASLIRPTNNPIASCRRKFASKDQLIDFCHQIDLWRLIPSDYAQLEMEIIDPRALQGYLITQMDTLFPEMTLDMEMIDYIINLLQHKELAHPDLIVAELAEFLGNNTRKFVRELWKYIWKEMVFVVNLDLVHSNRVEFEQALKLLQDPAPRLEVEIAVKNEVVESSTCDRDYKRRRKNYRHRCVNKSPKEVLRLVIDDQMKQMNRPIYAPTEERKVQSAKALSGRRVNLTPEIQQLVRCRDPLQVRDLFQKRKDIQITRDRSRSRSSRRRRYRSRSSSRDRKRTRRSRDRSSSRRDSRSRRMRS